MSIEKLEKEFKAGRSDLEKFLETSNLKYLNRTFRISKISTASKLFFYLGLIGAILWLLNFFLGMPWIFMWIYAIFIIFLSGFIFSSPDKSYNFVLVLAILLLLAFIPSLWGQGLLNIFSLDFMGDAQAGFDDAFQGLNENQWDLSGIEEAVIGIAHVMNWIIFLSIVVVAGAAVGDAWTLDFATAAQKVGVIAIALVILGIVYGIFGMVGETAIPDVFDTIGQGWNDLMGSIGLAQLDQSGEYYTSTRTYINGIYGLVPLIITVFMFSFAFYFRKRDLKSVLFARSIDKARFIKIQRTTGSLVMVSIILLIMGVYLVGYFLVSADPTLVVDPIITLSFYMIAIVMLLLIGLRVLILNQDTGVRDTIYKFIKWFIFGIMGLFLWFDVFQNLMFNLAITDGLPMQTFSTNQLFFRNQVLEQLFLVAMPETLIFQIGFIGIGNRVYYYFTRSRIAERVEESYTAQLEDLRLQYFAKINQVDPDSISKNNLRRSARVIHLKQRIDELELKIRLGKIEEIPKSVFVLPSLIFGLIGSFFFSWYHSFRRGIDFIEWWQNPMLGMVYFGAGFFLCLVAMFSFIASIGVHWGNNVIALMLSGG